MNKKEFEDLQRLIKITKKLISELEQAKRSSDHSFREVFSAQEINLNLRGAKDLLDRYFAKSKKYTDSVLEWTICNQAHNDKIANSEIR